MVAVVVAMVASYVVTRHVPMMAIVTAIVVIVFGTLTLVLHDETFIKMKPTIVLRAVRRRAWRRAAVRPVSFIAIMFDQMFKPDAAGLGGR